MVAAQDSVTCGVFIGMADFGTGLRAHLAGRHDLVVVDEPGYVPAYVPVPTRDTNGDERQRLETLAAELAGRELALAQREAELALEHEQMALALARALLQQSRQLEPAPTQVDELAALRARRYGTAS
jgi:hypothetical protein